MGLPAPKAKPNVLVADDDATTRMLITGVLRKAGMEVTAVSSGTEALAAIEDAPSLFDAAVLDHMMPGHTGVEVVQHVVETLPQSRPRLILASALGSAEEIETGLKKGADDYITKPLSVPDLRRRVTRQCELKLNMRAAESFYAQMEAELERASRLQASLLPRNCDRVGPLDVAFVYEPTTHLAGDILNVLELGDHHVGFYLADVCGHGVAASMLSVWAFRYLMPTPGSESAVGRPTADGRLEVADASATCQWLDADLSRQGVDSYVTLAYGLLDTRSNVLQYTAAGHPAPILLRADGACEILDAGRSPPLGMGASLGLEFEAGEVQLGAGDRVYFYSDGLTELTRNDEMVQTSGLAETLERFANLDPQEQLEHTVADLTRGTIADDDLTILAVRFSRCP